jgi:hypothetical protein
MAQWTGIGLAGIHRARRAPAHVHKKLRQRWPFRKQKDPLDPGPASTERRPPNS